MSLGTTTKSLPKTSIAPALFAVPAKSRGKTSERKEKIKQRDMKEGMKRRTEKSKR